MCLNDFKQIFRFNFKVIHRICIIILLICIYNNNDFILIQIRKLGLSG